jgi:hypothetical protein
MNYKLSTYILTTIICIQSHTSESKLLIEKPGLGHINIYYKISKLDIRQSDREKIQTESSKLHVFARERLPDEDYLYQYHIQQTKFCGKRYLNDKGSKKQLDARKQFLMQFIIQKDLKDKTRIPLFTANEINQWSKQWNLETNIAS